MVSTPSPCRNFFPDTCWADEDPKLNLLSLLPSATPYRSVKTRGPSIKCIACGPNASITDDLEAVPYDAFCGVAEPVEEEARGDARVERVRVDALRSALEEGKALVIDTRQQVEYGICALPHSTSTFPPPPRNSPADSASRYPHGYVRQRPHHPNPTGSTTHPLASDGYLLSLSSRKRQPRIGTRVAGCARGCRSRE